MSATWPMRSIFALLGTGLGVLTGLIPGLHVNNVAVIMLSMAPALLLSLMFLQEHGIPELFIPVLLSAVIVAMSIAHTFLDFILSSLLFHNFKKQKECQNHKTVKIIIINTFKFSKYCNKKRLIIDIGNFYLNCLLVVSLQI